MESTGQTRDSIVDGRLERRPGIVGLRRVHSGRRIADPNLGTGSTLHADGGGNAI